MKKKYKEPTMMVVCIKGRHQMLAGSNDNSNIRATISGYDAGGVDDDGFSQP
jgi:hypothetical protein